MSLLSYYRFWREKSYVWNVMKERMQTFMEMDKKVEKDHKNIFVVFLLPVVKKIAVVL